MFLDLIFQSDLLDEGLELTANLFLCQHISVQILYRMQTKWKVFIITFLSYAFIHGARTSWSSLKYTLNSPPFAFSPIFLGTLDMLTFIVLAFAIILLGPRVVKGGAQSYLRKGMIAISVVVVILGILLLFTVTNRQPYILVYPFIGLFSCVGWPACIYILSLYFEKGIAFSFWNGCIQFGDFIAILFSFVFVQAFQLNAGMFLFIMAGILLTVALFTKSMLSEVPARQSEPLPQASPAQQYVQQLAEQKQGEQVPSNDQMGEQVSSNLRGRQKKINFLNVWTLPGVSGYILSFVFLKAVYTMISVWLVFYLSMISMVKEAHIIALLWSASTFGGGILGIYINRKLEKKYFIILLFIAAIFFIFLEQMHLYPNQIETIILVSACGLAFGGPYTIMNTSIPLMLSEKPSIRQYPGAKVVIISAMEGYSLLFCGISLIFVPAVSIFDLHWVAFTYCIISALILIKEEYSEYQEKLSVQKNKKHSSEPVIHAQKERDQEWSGNLQSVKSGKKRRRTRRTTGKQIQSHQPESKSQKQSDKSDNKNSQENLSHHDVRQAIEINNDPNPSLLIQVQIQMPKRDISQSQQMKLERSLLDDEVRVNVEAQPNLTQIQVPFEIPQQYQEMNEPSVDLNSQ